MSMSLRKSWLIIVGENAPDGEKANAEAIADYLRGKLNIARVMTTDPTTFTEPDPIIELLMRFTNVVVVGGCYPNPYAFYLNEYCNPKAEYEITREKGPDETWKEYTASGAISLSNWLLNNTTYDSPSGTGIIGYGTQPYPRARPLEIWKIDGMAYEDTCGLGKAFRNEKGPGVYGCTWTDVTHEEPCPEDATCTVTAAPEEQARLLPRILG